MRWVLCLFVFLESIFALADAPVLDSSWQWNRNVKIDFVYGFWNDGVVQLHLDNGQYCYIESSDEASIAIALAMRAQQVLGEVVCLKDPSLAINGSGSRRVHRIKY